ncbi:hypothetical protein EDD63_11648 [Breznakia blatticola]|uniref:Uncharacterized protein n=2 Tax=Breznakia blatticola TaxID=1754012 RepID=A0A4R7ZR70_9FIRM|nr:hypothetical protein EDD63_11648 [Breznakia blatticola]
MYSLALELTKTMKTHAKAKSHSEFKLEEFELKTLTLGQQYRTVSLLATQKTLIFMWKVYEELIDELERTPTFVEVRERIRRYKMHGTTKKLRVLEQR